MAGKTACSQAKNRQRFGLDCPQPNGRKYYLVVHYQHVTVLHFPHSRDGKIYWVLTTWPASRNQPVNQIELDGEDDRKAGPGQPFAQAQLGLPGLAEPEAVLQCANLDGIAVAQDCFLKRLAVDGG